MTITLTRDIFLSGTQVAANSVLTLSADLEAGLVSANAATPVGLPPGVRPIGVNQILSNREIGNPVLASGVPFRLFSGNGSNSGLQWSGLRGTFTLSAAIYTAHYYSQIVGGYAYLPANFGGTTIPAGWYFYKMTSDTAGELYKDVYTSGIPMIPASPIPFGDSEISAGWLTQTTAEVTAINIPSGFKGNSMGPNGLFESILRLGGNSGNSGKYVRIRLGSSMVQGIMIYGTTLINGEALLTTRNQGVINSQSQGRSITNSNGNGVGAMTNLDSSTSRSTIDTSLTADLSVTMQLTANTDALLLYGVLSRITYGA